MKKIIYLLAIGLTISFASCTEEIEQAQVNFEIAVKPIADISAIEFNFSHLRAYQESPNSESYAIRTILLESKDCIFSNDLSWNLSLAKYTIEPVAITAFDLNLGCQIAITQDGLTRTLKFTRPEKSDFENLDLDINSMDEIDITFLLDLPASTIKVVDGVETMYPVFQTIVNQKSTLPE